MPPIVIGLSGGVDSAVAALRLIEAGHRVEGLFMKNWEEDDADGHCSAEEDLRDARQVADTLGIPLHTVNFSAEYWERVFEYFLAEYRAGRTPNPDVLCNREIKFKAFLDHALALGAEAIATGHYARSDTVDGRHRLLKGRDPTKDQSYFLHLLDQHQLAHARFPLGELEKGEVRRIAAAAGFANAAKKDSTGICFIGERPFREFLGRYLPAQPGDIETPEGEVIGRHHGLMHYTLGQRRGLGIGGRRDAGEEPWFAARKELARNVLIAVQGHDHPLLLTHALEAGQLHWIAGRAPAAPFTCHAKVRYRQQEQPCVIEKIDADGGRARVHFPQAQRAVTPGQSVVFYQGEACLGGGVIEAAFDE
ncbi:tRNA 2-thiouridine(34) synthase MnmA [Endothiovibrio diazotrophicus]